VSTETTRRAYRSPRRRQQAAENRAAVVATATRLFGERGWVGTAVRDVAAEAGVSLETVYANFRSKGELLSAAIDVAVVGDAEPVPFQDRPEFAALGRGTRQERIRATARLVTGIHERTMGLILALREAAASEPGLAALMRERELGRRADVEGALSLITGRRVTAEECDGVWALVDVGPYRLLTGLRGWTPRQYELWLIDLLDRLLPPGRRGQR
jgi:AcrR family transcriptional regulator